MYLNIKTCPKASPVLILWNLHLMWGTDEESSDILYKKPGHTHIRIQNHHIKDSKLYGQYIYNVLFSKWFESFNSIYYHWICKLYIYTLAKRTQRSRNNDQWVHSQNSLFLCFPRHQQLRKLLLLILVNISSIIIRCKYLVPW